MSISVTSAIDPTEVPESNRTSLELYVLPLEAYQAWKNSPDDVHFLDVRTFEEYLFVGHIDQAQNVPFVFPKYVRPKPGEEPKGPKGMPPGCVGEPNLDFAATVKQFFGPNDVIFVYCATGGRGAMAVNALTDAGFTKVYNIVTGLEGDRIDDPGSVFHGKHMRNGWKNTGLPWTYSFEPDLIESAQR